jgi:hypothetical protein
MDFKYITALLGLATLCLATPLQAGIVLLYQQDFENPTGFVNDGGDVNIHRKVNDLYGNQPDGFSFAQTHTVETLFLNGTQAFDQGYVDASGIGGNYALGMLANVQNDLLGLSFDVGSHSFLNVRLTISSIDLSVFQGPFVTPGDIPIFEFTLFDNPTGINGLGNGNVLDRQQAVGKIAPAPNVLDWTNVLLPLSTIGNTNGQVTLKIDLLSGGYAALDNFRITTSNTAGQVVSASSNVPELANGTLLAIGMIGFCFKNMLRSTYIGSSSQPKTDYRFKMGHR